MGEQIVDGRTRMLGAEHMNTLRFTNDFAYYHLKLSKRYFITQMEAQNRSRIDALERNGATRVRYFKRAAVRFAKVQYVKCDMSSEEW